MDHNSVTTFPVNVSVTEGSSSHIIAVTQGGTVTPGSSGVVANIGETTTLTTDDGGNGNLILAQPMTITQTGVIQSLSFYVSATGGQLRLGLYGNTSGKPGSKLAETNAFTPLIGWNTQSTLTQPSLQPGSYWLAYLPQSNSLAFRVIRTGAACFFKSFTFGVMPAAFPTSPGSDNAHWSFYGTFLEGNAVPTVWVNSVTSVVIPPGVSFTVLSVNLSNTTLSSLGAQNAGAIIGAITTTTTPPGQTQHSPITLGGADAALFSVSNGGILPCNLVAAVDIPAGSYSITLSAT